MEAPIKKLHQEFGLTFAHEALVDKHARELITDRFVQQKGKCGGIHATGKSQEHTLVTHLAAHVSHRFIDESVCGPIGHTPTDVIHEITQQSHAALRMHHLRVELDAVEPARVIRHGGFRRVVGMGQTHKAIRQTLHRITMAHPHRGSLIHVGEQIRGVVNKQRCFAIFSAASCHHGAAQLLHHQLHAVANPEHRNAQLPDFGVTQRRMLGIDRTGASTQDDSPGIDGLQVLRRGGVTHHQGIHLGFPHTPGDQFGILRSEIENHNRRVTIGFADGGGVHV